MTCPARSTCCAASAGCLIGREDPELRSRVGERLAYYLLQIEDREAFAEALRVAEQTVTETPAEPPTWYLARAMATYAIALMVVAGDNPAAREWAERARAVAAQSDAPWVEADALVTLGQLSSRSGEADEAIGLFTAAHGQAAAARILGVELRAAYSLALEHLVRGELTMAATVAHQGVQRADEEGLGLAPFGLDLQHLHFQAHYADGEWDHAQELADGYPVRVISQPEAVLSSMALFIDVARGNPAADERRTWLEPFWDDVFVAYIARGLLAEQALWRGDTDLALADAQAAISADAWPSHSPAVIRVAAVALSARADRACAARAAGDSDGVATEVAAAASLLDLARAGARFPRRPKAVLGPEGPRLARPLRRRIRPRPRRELAGRPGRRCWPRSARIRVRDRPDPVAARRGPGRGRPPGGGRVGLAGRRRDGRPAACRSAGRRARRPRPPRPAGCRPRRP